MNLRRDKARGEHAQRLLDDELFQEAFQALEDELTREFKESNAEDKETREDAHRSIRCLRHVQDYLKRLMQHGEYADSQLKESNNG